MQRNNAGCLVVFNLDCERFTLQNKALKQIESFESNLESDESIESVLSKTELMNLVPTLTTTHLACKLKVKMAWTHHRILPQRQT